MIEDFLKGRALKLDRMISSKDIVPGDYTESYHQKIEIIPMQKVYPDFIEEVFTKNILVGTENFGFGSSKEISATWLRKSGVKVIIAKTFFMPFYKNAFNIGLLCLEANTDYISHGDELYIDLKQMFIRNKNKLLGIKFQTIPKYFFKLYTNGGLLKSMKEEKRNDKRY